MEKYIIPVCDKADFSCADKAVISHYKWASGYEPYAYAKLIWINGAGLSLRMSCRETNPRSVYRNFGDPVYKDSCMEFFFSADGGNHYVNFEMNSAGALLSEFGTKDFPRTPISEFITPPKPSASISEDGSEWTAELFIPSSDIKTLFGTEIGPGSTITGNFYKCGDDTEIPHFGMWNEIDSDTPCFHLPQFFAPMTIQNTLK